MSASRHVPPPGTESLDSRGLDARVVRTTLADLAFTNRWFGGRSAVLFGLDRLLAGAPPDRAYSVLDLGAGMGDVMRAAHRRRGGAALRPLALDHHREAARLCRAAGIPAVVGDVATLPVRPGSVDVVVVSLLLHHFARPAAVTLVRRVDRLARWGVVITDLHRSGVAAAGIWLASFALRFHRVTRHDGVVSVRRGFTSAEMRQLLRAAAVEAEVYRRWGSRLVAVWRARHANP